MSPVSSIFGGCRTLMAKAVTNPAATGAGDGRRGEMYKIMPVSEALARFVGENEISFFNAFQKVRNYTDDHDLWNPENIEEILCDDKLKTIFDGKDKVFGLREMVELLKRHFPNLRKMSAKVAATSSDREIWLYKIVKVSEPLASFLGETKVSRAAALTKVWKYIDAHGLWDRDFTLLKFPWIMKKSKRRIRCDDKLKTIFNGKDKVGTKESMSLLMRHFSDCKLDD